MEDRQVTGDVRQSTATRTASNQQRNTWRNKADGRNAIWNSADPFAARNLAAVGDFDGNGASDMLWRNSNGANSIWRDADSGISQTVLSVDSLKWQIVR